MIAESDRFFFQSFLMDIFVMSLFSLHNDKMGRIVTRPMAVTIEISYENPTESGIFTVFERIIVP